MAQQNLTLPATNGEIRLKIEGNFNELFGHVGEGDAAHAIATESESGFMSAEDKVKLNNIEPSGIQTLTQAEYDALGAGLVSTVLYVIVG